MCARRAFFPRCYLEARLGGVGKKHARESCAAASRSLVFLRALRRLDLQIIYLRHVHSLCYYSGEVRAFPGMSSSVSTPGHLTLLKTAVCCARSSFTRIA